MPRWWSELALPTSRSGKPWYVGARREYNGLVASNSDIPREPADLPQLPGVTHSFVTLSTGIRMHVAEAGRSDAPVVLLLHGFPQHW